MKLKSVLLTFGLAITVGAASAVFANYSAKAPVMEARADDGIPGDSTGTIFYLYGTSYSNPCAHYWYENNGASNSTTWPGVAMKETSEGSNVWQIRIDTTTKNKVIFNDNGSSQTSNLDLNASNQYYYGYDSSWHDAALETGFYFLGDYNSWSFATAKSMDFELDDSNNGFALARNVKLTNGQFKGIYVSPDYDITWYSASDAQNWGVTFPNDGDHIWRDSEFNNPGIYLKSGSVNVDVSLAFGDEGWATYRLGNACSLKVVVGNQTIDMATSVTNFSEFKAVATGVANGASISFKYTDESAATYTPNSDAHNNVRDGAILIGGDITVYYNKYDDHTTWISGYENMMHFAEGFLADTITNGECGDPSETVKDETNVWNYYKTWALSELEQDYFNDLVNSADPLAASFTDDVEEAAARYIWLLEKYPSLARFSWVTRTSRSGSLVLTNPLNGQSSAFAVIVISTIAAATIGGFFFLRRRKEN